MMASRRGRAGVIAALGLSSSIVAAAIAGDDAVRDLALLAAAITLGELFVLRLEDRSSVPLSYAFMIVMAASSFGPREYFASAVLAEVVAIFIVRPFETDNLSRPKVLATRLVVVAATFLSYQAFVHAFEGGQPDDPWKAAAALSVGVLAQFLVDSGMRVAFGRGRGFARRARLAWLAVASSGVLMAIGFEGVEGKGELGIWAALLFSMPLLAAWYAFERLDAATLAYRQTIEALAMAPELAGLVATGHAERVAGLAVSIGDHLGLHTDDLDDLEMAALLHHVGQVTLDDPEVAGRPEPHLVAAVSAGMLQEIGPLAHAGDIVGGTTDDQRRKLAAQVLRVASEYDDLTTGDRSSPVVALETLRSAPRYIYDERVLSALERVVVETSPTAG
jgi:hypothetical protein